MKQQVNLYLPEFKVKKDSLSAVLMGQVLAGLVVVLLLVSAYDVFNRWQLNGELTQLRATLVEETRKTDELDDVLARRSENTALNDRLLRAEDRLEASRQIRDFFSQAQLGNVGGFSEYFKDLSRASIEGLSVTEFSFTAGGEAVHLAGNAVDSAMVPRYVDNIARGQSPLRAKQYSPAITRTNIEDQFFSFVLSTSSE